MRQTKTQRVLGIQVTKEELKNIDDAAAWIPLASKHKAMKAALHIGLVALRGMDQLEAVRTVNRFNELALEDRFKSD